MHTTSCSWVLRQKDHVNRILVNFPTVKIIRIGMNVNRINTIRDDMTLGLIGYQLMIRENSDDFDLNGL
ncbi:hypothetical protein Xets_03869 [Xenorhabdus sp. TS4]|nr:hypothetical protein [Xenorhabdus sp. TS4]